MAFAPFMRQADLCIASVRGDARSCRIVDLDRRLNRVYFLAFLNPSRGQPDPALTARLASPAKVGERTTELDWFTVAAWSAFGAGAGQDHSGGAGIIEANDQLIFTSLPCHRHPASGHPLRDLPADRGLPARHPQRGADRALPAGTSRSARPSRPVRSAARPGTPPVPSPAAPARGVSPVQHPRAARLFWCGLLWLPVPGHRSVRPLGHADRSVWSVRSRCRLCAGPRQRGVT
jgi:hypothetical protein